MILVRLWECFLGVRERSSALVAMAHALAGSDEDLESELRLRNP